MLDKKWRLTPPRARAIPGQVYLAGVVLETTEDNPKPNQIFLYSNNRQLLERIINDHNKLLELKDTNSKNK